MASLLTAVFLEGGIGLVDVPGLVVSRARRAVNGSEAKSIPRDARAIADYLRPRELLISYVPGVDVTHLSDLILLTRYTTPDQVRRAGRRRAVEHNSRCYAGRLADHAIIAAWPQRAVPQRSPASKAFYACKRAEGTRLRQALIALTRRRVKVLRATLRNRQPHNAGHTRNAFAAA